MEVAVALHGSELDVIVACLKGRVGIEDIVEVCSFLLKKK